jgi:hypothetical protein
MFSQGSTIFAHNVPGFANICYDGNMLKRARSNSKVKGNLPL